MKAIVNFDRYIDIKFGTKKDFPLNLYVPSQFNIRYIIISFIFSCLFINMISCKDTQNNSKAENKNLSFNINYDLLNKTPLKNDEGFSIYLPINWIAFDSTKSFQLKQALETNENLIPLELVGGYQSKDLSTCIISKINSNREEFQYIPENYIEILKSQFSTENINVSHIEINNKPVRQFIISNNKHTVIKLFISGSQNYQVDYIIPREVYETELGKIESSIGTITNKGEKR